MKFRGTFAILAATLVVAAAAANANAAKLVYTQALTHADNVNIPTGDVLYTIAVQTFASDGTGALGVSLTFNGTGGTAPIQTSTTKGAGANAVNTLQNIQDNIDNGLINAAGINGATYADSWFYSSLGGQLTTDLGSGPVPATSSPQLLYPGLSANPSALVWLPQATGVVATNTTGAAMSISGLWGNPLAAAGDPILAASLVGPGVYPLAQILVPANGSVTIANGASLGISTASGAFYNVLGGVNGDGSGGAGAFISGNPTAYLTNPLAIPAVASVPEPSTMVLAGLGLLGLLVARRRRK